MRQAMMAMTAAAAAAVVGLAVSPGLVGATPMEERRQELAAADAQTALESWATQSIDEALAQAKSSGDGVASQTELQYTFDVLLAYGDVESELLARSAATLRSVRQRVRAGIKTEEPLWEALDEHPELARAVALAVDEQSDAVDGVYALLSRLVAVHGVEEVAQRPQLTAALCVVHDEALQRRVGRSTALAADPMDIWAFYAANEARLMFPLENMPVELLVYVVNNCACISDMRWALRKHCGERNVGRLYHNVAYDYEHFLRGVEKKITKLGYTLPNIRRYGGVCCDQAYFAEMVGKSIGVPTCTVVARGTDMGHAWVGYLQARSGRGAWNFDEGCWEEYKNLVGQVRCPQSRQMLTDGEVEVLAEMIGASVGEVRQAAVYLEAARRLRRVTGREYPPRLPAVVAEFGDAVGAARPATVETRLWLCEAALRLCAGYRPAWEFIAAEATNGQLTLAQKQFWAETAMRLCGDDYPSFLVSLLSPMIATVRDFERQDEMWRRLGQMVLSQPQLAAQVCISRGKMFERAEEPGQAYDCYLDVVRSYAQEGYFVMEAIACCQQLLGNTGKGQYLLGVYAEAWQRAPRPDTQSPFAKNSVWGKVGRLYSAALRNAGQIGKANSIEAQVQSFEGKCCGGSCK